ncbi:MAG: glycoside hydrolase family 15 protein [Thermodesulfobacteriota bacterium]
MPKDIPVSNGNLLFNFDLDYQIRDIYFPLIGQENHSQGHPFRFGVWVEGSFSWIGPEWQKDLRYYDDNLITKVSLKNRKLDLELHCNDLIDIDLNLYLKKIVVKNLKGQDREVRLFLSHDFHIYGNDIGDTAYFDPRTRTIIHYKGHRYFLINCCVNGEWGVTHFACGTKERLGFEGTWRDSEDGELSGSPIGWGSADSTVSMRLFLPARSSATVFYMIAAGLRYDDVVRLWREVKESGPEKFIERTSNYWEAWTRKETRSFGDLPKEVVDIFNRSLLILRTQIDDRGAIIAANDSDIVRFGRDTYSYMWGRDGGFVAAALANAAYPEACRKFFEFCANVLTDEGYLFQHYNPDGTLASNWQPWLIGGKEVLPIQEDSTALVLWSFWRYYCSSKNIEFVRSLYRPLILRAADFLVRYRDPETLLPSPSYDLWEERYATHTYTVAAVIAGLKAAANFARLFRDVSTAEGYEIAANRMKEGISKYLYHPGLKRYARSGIRKETGDGYDLNEVIDVSLLALITLSEFSTQDPRISNTAEAVRRELWVNTPVGGCARYQNDLYQRNENFPAGVPGNPWIISTLWLADYFIIRARDVQELHEAIPYLEWCVKNALPSGVLAEQIDPMNGAPLSVAPLTWSHSAYVWTVMLYTEKFASLLSS